MKNAIKFLLVGIALFVSPQLEANESIAAGGVEQMGLGHGFDTETGEVRGVCVKGKSKLGGKQQGYIGVDVLTRQDQLSEALGVSASGSAKFGLTSMKAAASYAAESTSDERSIAVTIVENFSAKSRFLDEDIVLTDVGEILHGDGNQTIRFDDGCGDEYVSEIKRGAKIFVTLIIKFTSESDKKLFSSSFSFSSSVASAAAALKENKSALSSRTSVSLKFTQIGGDVTAMGEMLQEPSLTDSGKPSNFVSCSFGDLSKCEMVLSKIQEYIGTFGEQFKDEEFHGPADLYYNTKKYITAGVIQGSPPSVTHAIKRIRKQIDDRFYKALAISAEAQRKLRQDPFPLTSDQYSRIEAISEKANENLQNLIDAANECYQDQTTCQAQLDRVVKNYHNIDPMTLVVKPKMFRQFCFEAQSNHSDSQLAKLKSTIDVMVEVARAIDPSTMNSDMNDNMSVCDTADAVLKKADEFDVGLLRELYRTGKLSEDLKMYTVEPLMDMAHFKRINVSGQRIKDLAALQYFVGFDNLIELDLSNNLIENPSYIANLRSIESLSLSRNRFVRPLDSLADMPNLKRLDIRNNFEGADCPKSASLKVCVKQSYQDSVTMVAQATRAPFSLADGAFAKISDEEIFVSSGVNARVLNIQSNAYDKIEGKQIHSRVNHTATHLGGGRVLLVGGEGGGNYSAEIYSNGKFSLAKRESNSPRAGHEAILLKDGRVLITGGWEADGSMWDVSDATPTAEIFDPETNTMYQLPDMMVARLWHQMSLLQDGSVLITGGISTNGGVAIAEIFDPSTNSFRTVGRNMKMGRSAHAAAVMSDGRVLISGGLAKGDLNDVLTEEPLKVLEIFDPVRESFEILKEKMEKGRVFHTMTTLSSGHILILGGTDAVQEILFNEESRECKRCVATPEIYNPGEKSVTLAGNNKLFIPRVGHRAISLNENAVFVVGGAHADAGEITERFGYNLKPLKKENTPLQ